MTTRFVRGGWDRTVLVISMAVVLLAVMVIAGWHAHIRAAVQIFPGLVPMQYNTALCFLALGAAGVGLSTGRRLLMLAAGGFAALMGASVIVEYVTGISLGIDTLFFYPWERSLSADPGRMALTTAISFFLTGGALVNVAWRPNAHALLGIVSSVTLSLALTSLIGYTFQITYVLPFRLGSQMALHTSAAFLVYAIAMLRHAWMHAERAPDGLPKWVAGIGTALLPVLLVGAAALFPEQTWRVLILEALFAIAGVALVALAIRRLITARMAYKGLLMIAVPLILLLTFVGLVVHVKRQSESAQALARQSRQVLDVSHLLLAHIAETESAVRAYVITADETFVSSYAQSLAVVSETAARVRTLTSDNPLQEANAGRIEQAATRRMDHLSGIVRLVKAGNSQQAAESVRLKTGAELMTRVSAEMAVFSKEEERLDADRRTALEASWQMLSWLLVAGTAGAILLASILSLSFSGGIASRLQQLRDNAISLAAGKELARPLTGHDEIADLDRVFHEMAESLDEVTRRERAVIEGTTDGILIKDLEGRYVMVNQGAADLLGKTVAEVMGASVGDLYDAETARRVHEIDLQVIAAAQTSTYELRTTSKTGDERIFSSTRGPYRDRRGKIVGIIGISRDITERKLIEVELEHARDEAVASARLKSEFLANMSHEIRTPMNGVIGMTDLLMDTDLSGPQREFAESIQSSADALLTIIDDILDFSKIEAGLLRFEKIDFDLRAAVEATVGVLAEKAQAKGLELASLVQEEVPTALCGDPGRLRQVLTNLAGNAVKFTERGEVVVRVMKVRETATHAALRFEVQDTGIGIPADAQRRLFHAFVQADGSTTRKYGGTGLGLTISKQLVELMGGEIGIDSTPGRGSTFWFTAEFEKQPARTASESEPIASLSAVRVLIVDDNATNRSILKHQTTSWGMIATEAESGAHALEALRAGAGERQPYDIAILDLMMPGMDGFQLADAIKADPSIAAVALVLLPSYGLRGDGERARQSGIAAYLQKPVRQSQLYDCLAVVMAQSGSKGRSAPLSRLVTPHSIGNREEQRREKTFSSLRILVAEDNLVNQKVALGQLYNLGYHGQVVANGRELLEALEHTEVDVILMDCQMPEMDGFAATAEIRRREGAARHTTIIAMTANALEGDDQGCLAAGMDDYLSKPVKSTLLRQKLERWGAPGGSGKQATGHVIDQVQLAFLRSLQRPGEADYVTDLIDLFLNDAVAQLEALRAALSKDDRDEIRRVAHHLKGSSATMGATRVAALALELENHDPKANAGAVVAQLERELGLVRDALTAERIVPVQP